MGKFTPNEVDEFAPNYSVAIQKLAFDNWIVMDRNFAERMEFKRKICAENGVDAMDCREGGYEGCAEMLEYLV